MEAWNAFVTYMESLNVVSTVVRIVFAALCGGLLGLERRKAQKPAGMRTYMLICVGSAIISISSQYMFDVIGGNDVGRMSAQIVSGLGFLASSVIVVSKRSNINGITTAAEMWTAGAIGLSIGIGNYWVGFVGTAGIFIVMTVSRSVETRYLLRKSAITFKIVANSEETVFAVAKKFVEKKIEVSNIDVIQKQGYETVAENELRKATYCEAEITITSKEVKATEITEIAKNTEGVRDAWF